MPCAKQRKASSEADATFVEFPVSQPSAEIVEFRGDAMCRSPASVADFSASSRRVTTDGIGRPWTVSRVLFRDPVARDAARIIHLGDALLRHSSALTRMLRKPPLGGLRSGGPPSTACLFELAPGGACSAAGHPAVARGLLPHDFNLACASARSASQRVRASTAIGGVVSVALSLGSPRVAVSDLPAL